MAETQTPLKRQREETEIENFEESKRFKSYNQILSLLDEAEEDEPTEDLSSLITTLQQELETDHENPNTDSSNSFSEVVLKEDDDVIRHLLEASDDELGIPNMEVGDHDGEEEINGGDGFSWCDGLWELEDEAANYYTFLQSQLFM